MGQINRALFQIDLRTVPGNVPFKGQITAPETDLGTQRYIPGRRALVTPYGVRRAAGEVFQTPNGQKYLCGDGADNDSRILTYSVTHIFPMTHQLNVQRPVMTTHAVTGVKIESSLASLTTNLWVALESMLEARDTMGVPEKEYRIVTGYPLQESDVLSNGMVVRNIQHFLGVYVGVVR